MTPGTTPWKSTKPQFFEQVGGDELHHFLSGFSPYKKEPSMFEMVVDSSSRLFGDSGAPSPSHKSIMLGRNMYIHITYIFWWEKHVFSKHPSPLNQCNLRSSMSSLRTLALQMTGLEISKGWQGLLNYQFWGSNNRTV